MLIRSIGSICTATFKGIVLIRFAIVRSVLDRSSLSRRRLFWAKIETPIRSCDLCGESIDDLARHFAGCDHDNVETDIAIGMLRMAREPQFGRANHPALGAVGHRFHSLINAAAGFDFNEYQDAATPRDDVNFTEWRFPAPRQDAVGLGDQQ